MNVLRTAASRVFRKKHQSVAIHVYSAVSKCLESFSDVDSFVSFHMFFSRLDRLTVLGSVGLH